MRSMLAALFVLGTMPSFALTEAAQLTEDYSLVIAQTDAQIEQAIIEVEKNHGGRVLSAKPQADGTIRIKLITDDGVVKVVTVSIAEG
jgi:hypothetical protein